MSLGRADNRLADVRRAINGLRMPKLEEELEATVQKGNSDTGPEEWSDEVLEVLAKLGESTGGAVSKVKDRRSGRVMARKVGLIF